MKTQKKHILKRFIPFYRPYVKIFTFDLICALVLAAVDLVFPMLVRYLMNNGLSEDGGVALELILSLGGLLVALKLVQTGADYFVAYIGHYMGVKMEMNIRTKLFDKLQTLSHSFYDENNIGQLMSRATNDLNEITEFAHHCPEEFFIAAIKIIGAFILLCTINVYLTLALFALIPFLLLFAFFVSRRMRKAFKRSREAVGNINARLEDTLSGIRVVKSFANEDLERQKFHIGNDEFRAVKKRSYKIMGIFSAGITLFDGLMYVSVIVIGALLIANTNGLTVVDLVTYMLYINTLLQSIINIVTFTEQFQRGITGFERYLEIMDTPAGITDSDDAKPLENVVGEIRFENVTFSYSDNGENVLNNINLTVRAGENVALAGSSGGGKTTLVSLIPRFYDIKQGRITIDGHSITDVTMKSLRENVGIVQQDVYLFSGTVYENIAYGKPSASREEIVEAAKRAGAHEFIEKLADGYDTYVGERGMKLSGGQKQRISIARVFLKNPPILILDEATSALDNENEHVVQTSLEQLSHGRTTITVAHRLTTIKNADRIIVLGTDGILEQGTHDQLLSIPNGTYASMYKMYGTV